MINKFQTWKKILDKLEKKISNLHFFYFITNIHSNQHCVDKILDIQMNFPLKSYKILTAFYNTGLFLFIKLYLIKIIVACIIYVF